MIVKRCSFLFFFFFFFFYYHDVRVWETVDWRREHFWSLGYRPKDGPDLYDPCFLLFYSTRRLYSKHFSTIAPSATSGVFSNPSISDELQLLETRTLVERPQRRPFDKSTFDTVLIYGHYILASHMFCLTGFGAARPCRSTCFFLGGVRWIKARPCTRRN